MELIRKELEKQYMKDLFKKISIYDDVIPNRDYFWILKNIDLRSINLVIVGQDPYSTGVIEFNKFIYHYDGVAFSSKNTIKTPYSLSIMQEWFKRADSHFGYEGGIITNNLHYLLARGVLLMNVVWAVRFGTPLSLDYPEWYRFSAFVIKLVQYYNESTCFLLLGSKARYLENYIDKRRNSVFTEMHPAASRYRNNKMLYESNKLIECLKKIKVPMRMLR